MRQARGQSTSPASITAGALLEFLIDTSLGSRTNSAKEKNAVALPGSKLAIENETVEV